MLYFIEILFIVFLLYLKIGSDLVLFLFLVIIIGEGKSKMILNGYFKVMVNV